MNRTTKRISYFVFLSVACLAGTAHSALIGHEIGVLLSMTIAQVQQPALPKASPEEVEGLLIAARKAMQHGELKEAEAKLLRAESAKVRYPMLHFGDTPAKVRRDLDKIRRGGQAGSQDNQYAKQSVASRLNALASLIGTNRSPSADPFVKQADYTNGPVTSQPVTSGPVIGHPAADPLPLPPGIITDQANSSIKNGLVEATRLASEPIELTSNNPFRTSPANGTQSGDSPSALPTASTPTDAPVVADNSSRYPVGQGRLQPSYPSTNEPGNLPGLESAPNADERLSGAPRNSTTMGATTIAAGIPLPSRVNVAQALDSIPSPLPAPNDSKPDSNSALQLLHRGEAAIRQGNRQLALELFNQANRNIGDLDSENQQQLKNHLQLLAKSRPAVSAQGQSSGASLLGSVNGGQALLARQISADVGRRQSEAARLRESNPNQSLVVLREAQDLVVKSELDDGIKSQLARRIELSLAETEKYIHDHKGELELDEHNQKILDDIERQRAVRVKVSERVAELVDQFNTLRNEQRYAEMEVVAKRLYDMAPDEPVAQQVWENAKFIRRAMLNRELRQEAEQGVYEGLTAVQEAAILKDPDNPYQFPKRWRDLIEQRRAAGEDGDRLSPRELEIQKKLNTPVMPRYDDMPLSQVIEGLSELSGVNIHLDPRGMSQEGARSDTPITLDLNQEISLESALNLILEPLHLTFLIDDEVLKITSEQLRDGEVYAKAYNVADLVIPIPNFVPSTNMGLQGLINDAYGAMGYGAGNSGPGPMAMVANGRPGQPGSIDSNTALAQQFGAQGSAGGAAAPASGPGGMGAAANADFDSLIELITTTIETDSWMENGTGAGEIREFPTNLSIVVSQTQKIHEQIADLLEQLRRLQDLQVTIEVRFIRLTDTFFERIGIDFDFNIEDGSGLSDVELSTNRLTNTGAQSPSATVGVTASQNALELPNFTANLDIPYRGESFGLSTPQFGTPRDVATFGFAILSDIEAYFLINAAQGDTRANILQAPKVTLFNGQQAIVVDTAFVPFVISVIPVVGEFAAAQQPVIVVLSEGTMMTVQAVVSENRKYVRLTLVPFFSQIGNVQEFTFEGSQTSTSASNTTDEDDDGNNENDDNSNSTIRSGTTVQLPTFEVISVSTTVSVPDGGTVLLGGIKRLREGRNEFGVPLLSKVPYIDRLFRNVGIGRETDSLMMMVTPHIIIQEEEEERLGIGSE